MNTESIETLRASLPPAITLAVAAFRVKAHFLADDLLQGLPSSGYLGMAPLTVAVYAVQGADMVITRQCITYIKNNYAAV